MLRSFLFSFFILISLLAFGQTTDTEASVIKLFEKPTKIQWIKHYKGRIDDINDISIALAYDGRNCKGILRYLRSNETFYLDGKIKNNKIKLEEIDFKKRTSGYIQGQMVNDKIVGEWSNVDNTIAGKIKLEEVAEEAQTPSHCGNNKWLRIYSGKVNNEEVELILQKDVDTGVKGSIYFKTTKKSKLAIGVTIKDHFIIKITELDGNVFGTLDLTKEGNRNKLKGTFTNSDGLVKTTPFRLVNQYGMDCVEFADYMTSYDFTFPKTKNAYFNKWIEEKVDKWVKSCHAYGYKQKVKNEPNPFSRTSLRAFGWTDVHLLNDRLFSGFLTFSKTWSKKEDCISFNFDRTAGKMLELNELFIEGFDYNTFIKNYIKIKSAQLKLTKKAAFNDWIDREDFPLFTIRNEGLCFSSFFNPIFGQQHILLPFEKLRPYLKKDGPVYFLFEKNK